MKDKERTEAETNEQLQLAVRLAEQCLTNDGQLDYAKVKAEHFERLKEVGLVAELAEQWPIHRQPPETYRDEETGEEIVILTSLEVFLNSRNNFGMHFDDGSFAGKIYRRQAHARRFRLFFLNLTML